MVRLEKQMKKGYHHFKIKVDHIHNDKSGLIIGFVDQNNHDTINVVRPDYKLIGINLAGNNYI